MHWIERLNYISSSGAFSSVDGVNFLICEPSPFSPELYLHKINGPAVRQEIVIGIEQGNVVWANGLFMPRARSDLKMFKWRLKHEL